MVTRYWTEFNDVWKGGIFRWTKSLMIGITKEMLIDKMKFVWWTFYMMDLLHDEYGSLWGPND